ncbi:hypothetical protein [Microbacterium sp. P05]|uniref:hypothetical protein n=1 Tax=Microbacterium sp. P05 TaxID=3366948 RepID=UPI003745126D
MNKRMSPAGRRAAIVSFIGLGCGLVLGMALWLTTAQLALSVSVGAAVGLLLSGSAVAVKRSER